MPEPVLVRHTRALLLRELDAFIREIDLVPDDELLWRTLPGVTNSCGTLALHVAGNLQHYIGAVLGGTGYVRDRPAEFGRRDGTRAGVAAELARARDAVDRTLASLPDEVLAQPFPEAVGGVTVPTGAFLLHLASHLAFHLGQAGYLRRALVGEAVTSGAISIAALASALDPGGG